MTNQTTDKKINIIWAPYKDVFEKLLNDSSEPIEHDIDDGEFAGRLIRTKSFPMINTGQGPIPINEYNLPSKSYYLWWGYTNFEITQQVTNAIESVPGVEFLRIYTRYRFLVGFAPLFCDLQFNDNGDIEHCDATAVRNNILAKISESRLDNAEISVKMVADGLSKLSRFWAILLLPNMKIDIAVSDSDDDPDFKEKLELFKLAEHNVNAKILTSF